MVAAGQRTDAMIAAIAVDEMGEGRPRQKIHQLSKQSLASIHGESSEKGFLEDSSQALVRSSRHHQYSLKKRKDSSTYIAQHLS